MKTYKALSLNSILADEFKTKKGMSYKEASAELGVCSLTSVFIKNNDGEVIDKERVWMSYGGGVWAKTSGFADVGTVKGTYQGLPVIRAAKFSRVKAMTMQEAVDAIGACCLTKVVLCDADGNIIEQDGNLSYELVRLSLSGTYWARISGNTDENIGLTL